MYIYIFFFLEILGKKISKEKQVKKNMLGSKGKTVKKHQAKTSFEKKTKNMWG